MRLYYNYNTKYDIVKGLKNVSPERPYFKMLSVRANTAFDNYKELLIFGSK